MTFQNQIYSILASTEELISAPPMLASVLSSVFTDCKKIGKEQKPQQFNPSITTRMLGIADLSSVSKDNYMADQKTGYSGAKSLVLSLSIYNQLVDRGFDQNKQFKMKWQRFLEVANASQYIATFIDPSLIERAYIAGLLHDLGSICLQRYFPEETALASYLASDGQDILSAENSIFGTDHQQVGQLIATQWGMPSHLIEVICNHHPNQVPIVDLHPLTRIIILADNLLAIKQLNLQSLRSDPSRLNLVRECAESLGIDPSRFNKIYSIFPKHFLISPNSNQDQTSKLQSLTNMNDGLFSLYDELGQMFRQRQELSMRMLQESREEGRLESLITAMSTLKHYINNAIMCISGKGELLQMLHDKDDKDGVFGMTPDVTRTIIRTVRKISYIMDELSSIIDLSRVEHFKDSTAIDIDKALKARLELLSDSK